MSQVPPEIMNIVRRDMHASETIISAYHPDARLIIETPEKDTESRRIPMMRRILGRFSLDTSEAIDNDGKAG